MAAALALSAGIPPLAAREPDGEPSPGPDMTDGASPQRTTVVVAPHVPAPPPPRVGPAYHQPPARSAERARRRSNRHPSGKTKFTLGRLFAMASAPGGLRPRCARMCRAANLAVDKHGALRWDFVGSSLVYIPVDGVSLTREQAAIVLG